MMTLKNFGQLYKLIFLLVFLAGQASLILETAHHDRLDHEHNSQLCDDCLATNNFSAITPVLSSLSSSFAGDDIAYWPTSKPLLVADKQLLAQPRAPPLTS